MWMTCSQKIMFVQIIDLSHSQRPDRKDVCKENKTKPQNNAGNLTLLMLQSPDL